jgi:peptide-methionine (S)-S-oxide reductase
MLRKNSRNKMFVKFISFFNLCIFTFLFILLAFGCQENKSQNNIKEKVMNSTVNSNMEKATFGAGCFWCTEAIFERLNGIKSVVAGYAGGETKNPTYEEVCSGKTGHAEVCEIIFDPGIISYKELLEIFWKTHDPTTLNRQGNDVGTQYRSVIFYHNDQQKKLAEFYKQELDKSGAWENPIVTEISPADNFYPAEEYHQDYFEKNPYQGYCAFVIAPKVEKFEKIFKDKLK